MGMWTFVHLPREQQNMSGCKIVLKLLVPLTAKPLCHRLYWDQAVLENKISLLSLRDLGLNFSQLATIPFKDGILRHCGLVSQLQQTDM